MVSGLEAFFSPRVQNRSKDVGAPVTQLSDHYGVLDGKGQGFARGADSNYGHRTEICFDDVYAMLRFVNNGIFL